MIEETTEVALGEGAVEIGVTGEAEKEEGDLETTGVVEAQVQDMAGIEAALWAAEEVTMMMTIEGITEEALQTTINQEEDTNS